MKSSEIITLVSDASNKAIQMAKNLAQVLEEKSQLPKDGRHYINTLALGQHSHQVIETLGDILNGWDAVTPEDTEGVAELLEKCRNAFPLPKSESEKNPLKQVTLGQIWKAVENLEDTICEMVNSFQKHQKIRVREITLIDDLHSNDDRYGVVAVHAYITNEFECDPVTPEQQESKVNLETELLALIREAETHHGIQCSSVGLWVADNCWDIQSVSIPVSLDGMCSI